MSSGALEYILQMSPILLKTLYNAYIFLWGDEVSITQWSSQEPWTSEFLTNLKISFLFGNALK